MSVTIDSTNSAISEQLKSALACVSTDKTRVTLTQVLFRADPNNDMILQIVGCNSYLLYVGEVLVDIPVPKDFAVLIPSDQLKPLVANKKPWRIVLDNELTVITKDGVDVSIHPMENDYPKIDSVMPPASRFSNAKGQQTGPFALGPAVIDSIAKVLKAWATPLVFLSDPDKPDLKPIAVVPTNTLAGGFRFIVMPTRIS